MANPSSPLAQKVKQKQMMILGGVGLGVMMLAIVSAYFVGGHKKPAPPPTVTTTRNLIDATTDTADREKWRERSAQDIERLRYQMAEQTKVNASLQKMIDDLNQKEATAAAAPKQSDADKVPTNVVPPPAGVLPPPSAGKFLPGAPIPQASTGKGSPLGGPGMVMPGLNPGDMQPTSQNVAVQTVKFDKPIDSRGAEQKAGGNATGMSQNETGGRPYRTGPNGERIYFEGNDQDAYMNQSYIPAGTFARAVILGGVDAPTGGQAQNNPNPVLLRILGDARLPGGARVNMKDCVATADAVGELSSERVQIRLQRLACRVGEDKIADIAVKGHVDGEDGKAGMRARLVTKTGQVLGNALLTGTLSALGTAIQSTTQSTASTALGTVTTTNASSADVAKYAVGGGVSKAFDRLANYYINLADKIFPVLELDSMRVVDIVFAQGFTLEAK